MRLQRSISLSLLSLIVTISTSMVQVKVFAQGGEAPMVSTVTLQVVPGQAGLQSVLTPRGMVVPLPGAGVNANAVQIYMGAQGGAWYVDKNGQSVDLTSAVEKVRMMAGQASFQQAQVPQYAPAPPPVIINNPPAQPSSGSGTAALAGLGAMGGAMAGAAIANSTYNNTPYGTPVYYPHGAAPYYRNASGNTVNVNHTYTGADTAAYYNAHASTLQQQEAYYAAQQHNNSAQYQTWQQHATENPFVNQAYHGYAANPAAAGAAAGAYHENQQGLQNPAAAGAAAGAYHENQQGFKNPAAAGAAAGSYHQNQEGFDHAGAAGAAAADSQQHRGRFGRGGSDEAGRAAAADGGRFHHGDDAAAEGGRFRRGGDAAAAEGGRSDRGREGADGGGRRGRRR